MAIFSGTAAFRQLAPEIGGQFIEPGLIGYPVIHAPHRHWIVTLDFIALATGAHGRPRLRLRAPFANPQDFRFIIYRKAFLNTPRSPLPVIQTGHADFDTSFGVKTNDASLMLKLFTSPSIPRLSNLLSTSDELLITDHDHLLGAPLPQGVSLLWIFTENYVDDPGQLKGVFESFTETLDQLASLGIASDREPEYKL